jgi:peptidyl-prolyl cis-trans isomerase C
MALRSSSLLRPRTAVLSITVASIALSIGGALVACGDDDETGDPNANTAGPEELRHGLTKAQADEVLAKVGSTTITVGDFADQLADQSPYLRRRYNSPERRREFLDNLVRFELLALEAERQNLDDLPEVQRTRKQMMIQQMMRELFDDRIQLSDVTDEEVRRFYEENRNEFQKPEQVRASQIVVKNRAAAQRLLTSLRAREDDVAFFREMAEQYNEDPATRDRFGDLRFFSRPAERPEGEAPVAPDAVAEAAFSIERIGGTHPTLVESEQGFHIVKLTGRRAAFNRTFEESRRPIQNRLWRERRERAIEDFVAELRSQTEIEEHPENIAEIRPDFTEGDAPEVPGVPEVPGMPEVPIEREPGNEAGSNP